MMRLDPCGYGFRDHFMVIAFPEATTAPTASPAHVRNLRDALEQLLAEVVEDGAVCPEMAHLPSTHAAVAYARAILAETKRFA